MYSSITAAIIEMQYKHMWSLIKYISDKLGVTGTFFIFLLRESKSFPQNT